MRAISSGLVSKTLRFDVGVDQLVGEQLEPQPELVEQLVLPLLDQAARGDDQAALARRRGASAP